MSKQSIHNTKFVELRRLAEAVVADNSKDNESSSTLKIEHLIHELQVYQVELEMQNDELQTAQLELENALDKYTELYDNAPVGYLTLDKQWNIGLSNNTLANILGEKSENLFGQPFSSFVFKDDQDILHMHRMEMRKSDTISSCRVRMVGVDEALVHVQLDSVGVVDESDRSNRYRTTIRTTTREVELEQQLRQAQKMESVGVLTGGIAHEFNNILAIIVGNAELASLGISESNKAILDILKTSKRGTKLVQQLLTIGHRSKISEYCLDPVPIIKDVISLLRSTLPVTIEIFTVFDWLDKKVQMDPTQLHQIIMNLCTNASHAMGEKGGKLEIVLTSETVGKKLATTLSIAPGEYLQLLVKDSGCGIPLDVQGRIFEPFFTTKEFGVGTGLGLSVVHGVVVGCKGAIKAESHPGKGAQFKVYLPVADISCKLQPNPFLNEQIPVEEGMGRVLFVDDEPGLVDVGVKLLELLGYKAVGATDPLDGLKAFLNEPQSFVAVVTDQVMPGLLGSDLAQQILLLRPDIPIFVCTGYSETMTQENAEEKGLKGVFMKPVSLNVLSKALKDAIS
jgi:two-component system, cell cycle sensor histidine kinase and response regulator CckA